MARELREEVGLSATPEEMRLFGLYSSFAEGKSDHIAVFTTDATGAVDASSREVAEAAFFAMTALPHDVAPATAGRIQEFREGRPTAAGEW